MRVPFLDKADEKLVTRRPHLWLARLHIATPIGLLFLVTTLLLASGLPLHTAIYPYLIGASLISIFSIAALMRFQYLYYNKNFTPKQLNQLFLVNSINILLFLIGAVIIPCNLGQRVQSALNKEDFTDLSNNIRIAMIPAKDCAWIRAGALDSANPGQFASQAEYQGFLNDVQSNKFITSALAELNFNNFTGTVDSSATAADTTAFVGTDSTATRMAADSTRMAPDSSAVRQDSSSKMLADTSKKDNSAKDTTSYLKHYNYSAFLLLLRAKTDQDIAQIKANIGNDLQTFDFPAYQGDSSLSSLNDYYAVLNQRSLNLYATRTFYGHVGTVLGCLFVLLMALAQFSILSLSRNRYLILVMAMLVFFGMAAAVILSADIYILALVVIGGAIVASLGSLRIFGRKARYGAAEAFCYYLLHFMASYLVVIVTVIVYCLLAWIVGMLFVGHGWVENALDLIIDGHAYKLLIVPVCLFIFLMYKIYYRLVKQVAWIGCLPKF
ncbi:MAG TPA: hypothetical protein VFE32_04775 [Puia sp.]|jgi:hypothetical protein|nr:hypothetical protein [Puia sp.]